jgi:hypothetical protein
MLLDQYHGVFTSSDFQTFEFISTGPRGNITKVVRYSELDLKDYFNLGFGDKNLQTGFICDLTVSDNKDSLKVLATIASTVYAFTENYPNASILASGSTQARTRLYQIGITNHLEAIQKDFVILGLIDEDWEPFCKGTNYNMFLIRKKL